MAEQPRDETGRYAVNGIAPPGDTQPQAEQMYEVKVEGQTRQVTQKELVDSYQLAEVSRRRLEQAAEQQRQLERERGAIGGTRPPSGFEAPTDSPWSGPFSGGGFTSGNPQAQPSGQPWAATPNPGPPQPAPTYGNDEDYATLGHLTNVEQDVARLQQQNQQMYAAMQRQQFEVSQERKLAQMEASLPGFSAAAVEAAYYALPRHEQAELDSYPRAVRARMLYFQNIAPSMAQQPLPVTQQPQAEVTQPQMQPIAPAAGTPVVPPAPPFQEGVQNAGAGLPSSPQAISGAEASSREKLMGSILAFNEQNIEK